MPYRVFGSIIYTIAEMDALPQPQYALSTRVHDLNLISSPLLYVENRKSLLHFRICDYNTIAAEDHVFQHHALITGRKLIST